jgi:hypothetical protein
MKHAVLVGTLIGALGVPVVSVSAQFAPPAAGASLGSVTLNRRVMADGKPLAPGTYQVRVTGETPKPGLGQSPDGERYIEFMRGGKVVAREVATVISASDIGQIVKGARPPAGGARVELLKGNDYVRVWINRGGANYIINLPTAT